MSSEVSFSFVTRIRTPRRLEPPRIVLNDAGLVVALEQSGGDPGIRPRNGAVREVGPYVTRDAIWKWPVGPVVLP
jgi:hypothetical protein